MKWLHISDLHFGNNSSVYYKEMWENLPQIQADTGAINYLFITGDLRYAKECGAGYPPDVEKTITKLQEEFQIGKKNTFIVPGNHDVTRGDARNAKSLQKKIETAIESYKEYKYTDGGMLSSDAAFLKGNKRDFYDLRNSLSPHSESEGDFHYCVPCVDCNIVGLDTAITSGQADNEKGLLCLDMSQVARVFSEVNKKNPTIVLAHHDLTELDTDEQRRLQHIMTTNGVILYLCGHSHHVEAWAYSDSEINFFKAGTFQLHETKYEYPDMDVLVGELNPVEKKGCVKAYRWDFRAGSWFLDPAFSYKKSQFNAKDGCYYFPKREKEKTPSYQNLQSRYLHYLIEKCGKADLHSSHSQNRNIRIDSVFVPPHFQKTEYSTEQERLLNKPSGPPKPEQLNERHTKEEIALCDILSSQNSTPLRAVILSAPGGGKSTLLKCIAKRCAENANENRFPVWLRGRDFRERDSKAGQSFPVLTAAVQYAGRQANLERDWKTADSEPPTLWELVQELMEKGRVLFLIDGLDEISYKGIQSDLIKELGHLFSKFHKASLILTLRDSGLHAFEVTDKENEKRGEKNKYELPEEWKKISFYRLSPLAMDDVKDLCVKWIAADNDSAVDSEKEGLRLAETIIQQVHTASLATTPLMLTLMLLVRENHEGWLPDTPVSLYAEAASLLLERWATDNEQRGTLDLEETRYQLSFIAFSLRGTIEISESQLVQRLEEMHKQRDELVYRNRKISSEDFLKIIQKRNALLLWNGIVDDKTKEYIYEFQHHVFYAYFSAYAVERNCYQGYQRDDRPLDPFLRRLWQPDEAKIDSDTEQILFLTAAMDPVRGQKIAYDLAELLEKEPIESDRYLPMKKLLLRFLTEEIRLDRDTVWKVLDVAFRDGMTPDDPIAIYRILHGRYCENLRSYFIYQGETFHGKHGGGAYWNTCLDMLAGKDELKNVWQYYRTNILSPSPDNRLNALTAISTAIWMNCGSLYPDIPEMDLGKSIFAVVNSKRGRADLVSTLLIIAMNDEPFLRWHALRALHQGFYCEGGDLLRGEDFLCYLCSCVEYMNRTCELPLLNWDLIVTVLPVLCREYGLDSKHSFCGTLGNGKNLCQTSKNDSHDVFLSVEAWGRISTDFEQKPHNGRDYEKLISFFILALLGHTDCVGLKRVFDLLLREQQTLLEQGKAGEIVFETAFQFAESLDEAFLGNRYDDNNGERWWRNTLDDYDDEDAMIMELKPLTPYAEPLSPYLESCIYHLLLPIFRYVQNSGNKKHVGLIRYCPSLQVRFHQPGINEHFDVDKALRVMQGCAE